MHAQHGALKRFQDDFARALVAPDDTVSAQPFLAALMRQPGFSVYRNTVMKGCIDALQANYPAVARLVGEQWFRAAAAIHVRESLPRDPMLFDYGDTFVQFLAQFAPARGLPYLTDVARLDRFWTEAHTAHDEEPVLANAVAQVPTERLARVALRPHASARWAWFDTQPIVTLWRRNRTHDDGDCSGVAWRGEGVLLVRPRDTVMNIDLDAAGCAFLDACAAGLPLADAAVASLSTDAGADLSCLMARLLEAGALGSLAHLS